MEKDKDQTAVFTGDDIQGLDRIYRLNLINSVLGYKPAVLIGTIAPSGATNLSIVSSAVHLGSDPPLIGFIQRPLTVARDTYDNLRAIGSYTMNQVREDHVAKAHYTSARFPKETSEFAMCQFTEEYLDGFPAPFVAESRVKIGLQYVNETLIKENGTILVIGRITRLVVPQSAVSEQGHVDLRSLGAVCVSGLQTYHTAAPGLTLPYARTTELPSFD